MQNAELRTARDEVETALGKYVNLYDFATISEYLPHCPHDSSIPQLNFS